MFSCKACTSSTKALVTFFVDSDEYLKSLKPININKNDYNIIEKKEEDENEPVQHYSQVCVNN